MDCLSPLKLKWYCGSRSSEVRAPAAKARGPGFHSWWLPSIFPSTSWHTVANGMKDMGVARILRKGVLSICALCARKFWPRPLMKWKGRSSNYHRECVLTELESRFLSEFRDKVSDCLLSCFSYSSWWFGIAKGVLDETVLWTMLTTPKAEGGCSNPLSTPLAMPLVL